ncbi:MAG: hypothetical protein A3J38_03895 [Gammaproteobacteria bacterium RIFCSPHIGHO2_12_FULL_45_9]|nr:MAG: hypothetical protein A3J38_03895 [Gammaproteobacteria bacterium RIFCSPHIGHO2_12_FULL_45_9]
MNWSGKLIGLGIGIVLGNPLLMLVGLGIGHLYDTGWLQTILKSRGHIGQQHLHQAIFFDATFQVMGYLAKIDGRVSEREIAAARRVMDQMGLSEPERLRAIDRFNEGKQTTFDISATLSRLKSHFNHQRALRQIFLEIQWQVATADGAISPATQRAFEAMARALGVQFSTFGFYHYTGQQEHTHHHQHTHHTQPNAKDPYLVLGLKPHATKEEIKKAYRRLMSQHHPDKLMAKGLAPEMIKLANQKTQEIKEAYETLKKSKGIS